MKSSVFSDNMAVLMHSGEAQPASTGGSALQNPDLSRAHLGKLLRGQDSSSKSKGRTFWPAFLAQQAASTANGNG